MFIITAFMCYDQLSLSVSDDHAFFVNMSGLIPQEGTGASPAAAAFQQQVTVVVRSCIANVPIRVLLLLWSPFPPSDGSMQAVYLRPSVAAMA